MPISNSIPFLDLVTPHAELEQELTGVFRRALCTAGFIGGPVVEEFERHLLLSVTRAIRLRLAAERMHYASLSSLVEYSPAMWY